MLPTDEALLIAIANTGHEDADELADADSVRAWWPADEVTTGPDQPRSVARLRALRSLIRRLTWTNNGVHLDPDPAGDALLATLSLRPEVTGSHVSLRPARATGLSDAITAAGLTALLRAAARPGWPRVKACHALDCGWVFQDASRNAARRWCDMRDCGNRAKGAAFRIRERASRNVTQPGR
ncbi:CGNR zinc finger domain-containing protein [Actinoplanes sp. Pm04-4]|uniref:CGNR zinc finger domain-containing protein n=1 Tax=Paractinoplanes pyxinae TaxID=2997416 RepID=A0ABT4BCE8_9ACTN|nr:CGNR zinc finger domain-containing protein [Actinoplanes pyxinae]MCY1144151.1 CGNR zinc finger domain-containing protein [Actinoplanes pyxinae]